MITYARPVHRILSAIAEFVSRFFPISKDEAVDLVFEPPDTLPAEAGRPPSRSCAPDHFFFERIRDRACH